MKYLVIIIAFMVVSCETNLNDIEWMDQSTGVLLTRDASDNCWCVYLDNDHVTGIEIKPALSHEWKNPEDISRMNAVEIEGDLLYIVDKEKKFYGYQYRIVR